MEATYRDINHEVIEKCKLGDRTAQYRLYELYNKAMYNLCLRIVKNEDEAEDVLQEAFIKAFKSINNYQGKAAFGAWLKRIVVNQAIYTVRKQKMVFEDIENQSIDLEEEIFEDDFEFRIEKVKKAMNDLSEGYRVVLSLYLFEGYEHKEISEILGISESTSKTQYVRGKKKLKELLNG